MDSTAKITAIFSLVCMLLTCPVSTAQDNVPPSAADPGVPGTAKVAGAQPEPQPLAGAPDRLVLTDAWLKHLDSKERDRLELAQPLSLVYAGLGAALWSTLAVTYQDARGDWAGTSAFAGAAAANLVFLAVQALTPDPYDSLNLFAWNGTMNLAFIATTGLIGSNLDRCAHDCSVLTGTLSAVLFAYTLYQAAFRLFDPPIWVSRHYRDYQQLSAAERPRFALELFRAQERRNRREFFFTMALALISGTALVVVGAHLSGMERTLAYVAGGIDLAVAAVTPIVWAFETPMSERLLEGEAPPQPTAF